MKYASSDVTLASLYEIDAYTKRTCGREYAWIALMVSIGEPLNHSINLLCLFR